MRAFLILVFIGLSMEYTSAQKWMERADFGGVGRHRAAALTIGNKGYVGIGHSNGTGNNIVYNDWWQYDPASNSWTQKADYISPNGNYAAIVFATDTKGYIGGGTAYSIQYLEYDPVINTWVFIADCPISVSDQTAFAVNNKGYVIDGNQCYEYNPATGMWAMKSNMPFYVGIWSTSFVIDGSAYVKSGTQLYEYKASIDTWVPRAACPGVATAGSSSFSINGKGYVISGYIGALSELTKEIWEFNPGNNVWTRQEDFEGSSRRFSVGIAIQDRGYFGLGTNGINFNDWWTYDGTSVGLSENEISCNVYPNPVSELLKVQVPESLSGEEIEALIFDSFGKIILKETLTPNDLEIDLQQISGGSYQLQLIRNNEIIHHQSFQKIGV